MPRVPISWKRIGILKPSFDDLLSSDYRNHPRYRGVVGHWLMNESGGLTAYDISGNGNHGTLTNGPVWTQGQFGPALSFDGSNDYVDTANIADNLSEMTVSVWFKTPGSVVAPTFLVSKIASDASGIGWIFRTRQAGGADGQLGFWTQGTGGSTYHGGLTTTEWNDDLWHHAVVTLSGGPMGTVTIYADGVSQALTASDLGTVTSFTNALNVRIGADSDGTAGWFWTGSLDDVRVYNRAMSADEVMSLYTDPFLEFQRLEFYRWIRRIITPESIIPVLTTPPVYRPTLIGVRTI